MKFDYKSYTPIAEGGEGFIYEYKGKIVKVYKEHVDKGIKEKKIKALMAKPRIGGIVYPLDTVEDENGRFIGFIMDKIEGEDIKKLSNKKYVTSNNISTKDILAVLLRIQSIIIKLHKQGIIIGDLNDQNIIIDKNMNVYFIDCDSWCIDGIQCDVAIDLFKDPCLQSNNFDKNTDAYAFSILAWKLLTRVHPFGGTVQPDIPTTERMERRISIIDRANVTIPRIAKQWNGLAPELIEQFKDNFENGKRTLIPALQDMADNLSYCQKDGEYYYSKFNECPYCNSNAKIQTRPVSLGSAGGLRLVALINGDNVRTVFNRTLFLNTNNEIEDMRFGTKYPYSKGYKYYYTEDGYLIEDSKDEFIIHSSKDYTIPKKYNSNIVVEGNIIYYISDKDMFTKLTVTKYGNDIFNICRCSTTSYFGVYEGKYCIVNYYRGKLVISVNGSNIETPFSSEIVNYGIHCDNISGKWMILFEDKKNRYYTYVITETGIEYKTDEIRYECMLYYPCISNSTIYIPIENKIRGYNYSKLLFKDFECDVVDAGSNLIKNGKRFEIVNDDNIYVLG